MFWRATDRASWLNSPKSESDLKRTGVPENEICKWVPVSRGQAWGVDSDRLFEFWSYVGGRYSSSASAGVLPLALSCGSEAPRAAPQRQFAILREGF